MSFDNKASMDDPSKIGDHGIHDRHQSLFDFI